MKKDVIIVPVKIDDEIFREFAWFDCLRHRKRWRPPVIFAAILLGFAAVCFAMNGRAEQATLLGIVLSSVGVLLPAAYFLNFSLSISTQIKRLGLSSSKQPYTVTFRDDDVDVVANAGHTSFSWNAIYRAYRVRGGVYMYVSAARAYLLPCGQATVSDDALWNALEQKLSADKLVDKSGGKRKAK